MLNRMSRHAPYFSSLLAAISALTILVGCNTILGLDDILIDEDSTAGSGAGSANAANGNTANPSSSTSSQVPMGLADGVYIQSIAIYQGTERSLMAGGVAASSDIPIVAGRKALLRIFYTSDANYDGDTVLARLTIGNDTVIEGSSVLGPSSDPNQLASTINLSIDGEALVEPTSYRVEILQPASKSSNTNTAAAYPVDTADSLPVQSAGSQLKIVLVPIAYAADGSNRLPDVSPAQIEIYANTFYKLYPVRQVDVLTTGPITWNGSVSANGSGWSQLLNAVSQFRQSNNAAPDEYYYGIVNPKSSFSSYCNGSCVAGLSMQAGPNDAMGRAGIGVGFSGERSANTAAHEVGHQHGRGHAPCQVSNGVDPSFPYSDGGIGKLGYDLVEGVLVSTSGHTDFMGYCDPTWVSDYHFKQLFNRIKFVNGAAFSYPGTSAPQWYSRISLTSDSGQTPFQGEWLEPLELATPPAGEPLKLTIATESGSQSVEGQFFRYSHIQGGVLLFQKLAASSQRLSVVLDHQTVRVVRAR